MSDLILHFDGTLVALLIRQLQIVRDGMKELMQRIAVVAVGLLLLLIMSTAR